MSEKTRLQDYATKNDGDGFITINGNIEPAFKFAKLEITTEMITETKRPLNNRVEQNAVRGMKISGNIGYYNTTSVFEKAVEAYKNGGSYPSITVQGWAKINGTERKEILVTDVIINKLSLIMLEENSSDSTVNESDITANDYQVIQ